MALASTLPQPIRTTKNHVAPDALVWGGAQSAPGSLPTPAGSSPTLLFAGANENLRAFGPQGRGGTCPYASK